jgi:hypothetical protein
MLHQHSELSSHSLQEATRLSTEGADYSHLVKFLDPEHYLRLKLHIQSLPRELAELTIFGKVHFNEQSASKQKKRK